MGEPVTTEILEVMEEQAGAAGVNGQGQGNEGSFGLAGSAGANNTITNVYIDPSIWTEQNPVVMCHPPCQLILPPFPIQGESATITPGSLTTTLNVENNVAQTTNVSGNRASHQPILRQYFDDDYLDPTIQRVSNGVLWCQYHGFKQ